MATDAFPPDLAAAQLALHQVCAELSAVLARLPLYAVPTRAWTDSSGHRHPASPGWSEEALATVDALWDRQQELGAFIGGHPAWDSFRGPALIDARTASKHLREATDAVPVPGAGPRAGTAAAA